MKKTVAAPKNPARKTTGKPPAEFDQEAADLIRHAREQLDAVAIALEDARAIAEGNVVDPEDLDRIAAPLRDARESLRLAFCNPIRLRVAS